MYKEAIEFIKSLYPGEDPIALHRPLFVGDEKKYLSDCIDSTFVSYVGENVAKVEKRLAQLTKAKYVVAISSGTQALHLALATLGVRAGDEVITQALSFVATANAIKYCHADPIFIDSHPENLGPCPKELERFLTENAQVRDDGKCYNKKTNKRIVACIPVHVFGHPALIEDIVAICRKFNIFVLEDAAESLGSYHDEQHTGTFGDMGIVSFNGNKIVTAGGGGAILTNDKSLYELAAHLSSTAKEKHPWEFNHDVVGFNYRMPNLNASLLLAQLENLAAFLDSKRALSNRYAHFFKGQNIPTIEEGPGSCSNYWLNAIVLKDLNERDEFLKKCHQHNIQARPIWRPLPLLTMYRECQKTDMVNAMDFYNRIVTLPSSVRL